MKRFFLTNNGQGWLKWLTFFEFINLLLDIMDMPLTPSDDLSRPETLSETLTVVKKIIERSVKPLTADEIHQDIPGLYQLKKQDMVRLLQKEAASGSTPPVVGRARQPERTLLASG